MEMEQVLQARARVLGEVPALVQVGEEEGWEAVAQDQEQAVTAYAQTVNTGCLIRQGILVIQSNAPSVGRRWLGNEVRSVFLAVQHLLFLLWPCESQ